VPYPRRLLNRDEKIALDLKPHWWFFSKQIFTGVPLLILLIVLWSGTDGTLEDVSLVTWAIVGLVWAGWLALKYLDWQFTHFVVTGDRVIFRTGVLAKRGVEIPLERINNINFSQSIWERVIGAGDLEIESAGKDGQSTFEDVRHPDAVQQELYRQMEGHARKRASWTSGAAAPLRADASIPDQISQLADLRDRGVISVEEFETKKAQLLERM
jgi:uncharacterized membrane protein YdbT with pleckstrin-like domain